MFYPLLLLFPAVLHLFAAAEHYSRADFPADFVFGSATSAYQYEGAASEDGRTPSVWDTFAHSGRTSGANGDVACDGYHKYKDDIRLMSDMGLEAFRFSISWSRLIPNGRGPINQMGLQYYNNFINELIFHGIQPHITLHHFDFPQALDDEYGGWLSRKIVKDFTAYADVCFKEFGDRVLHWTTVNEANILVSDGYNNGVIAPGHCSSSICAKGNSSTEPYLVAHNILLAHSATANLYKKKYKATQKGYIGINIYGMKADPYTNTTEDIIAAQRFNDYFVGWFMNPLVFGDYPKVVKQNAGGRIPIFTEHEAKQIKGSLDFVGVNHYFRVLIKDNPSTLDVDNRDLTADMAVQLIFEKGDPSPGKYAILPSGLSEMLEYLKQDYGNLPVYIHENGQMTQRNGTLVDTFRAEYIQAYIGGTLDAIRNGSNAKGYFVWSFLDCLELLDGYESSYGFYYVDLDVKELKRFPKFSAHWYSGFLKGERNSKRNGKTHSSW